MKFRLNKIFSNSLLLLVGRIGTVIINLSLTIKIARTLGEDLFGEFSFFLAYMSIALVVAVFGMDVHVVRSVASKKEHSLSANLSGALIIQLFMGLLVYLISFVWSISFSSNIQSVDTFLLYLLIIIPSIFGTILNSILKGEEKMGYFVLYLLSDLVIQLIGVEYFLSENANLFTLVLILLSARITAVGLAVYFVNSRSSSKWQLIFPDKKSLVKIFTAGGYISLAVILTTVVQRLGVLTLSHSGSHFDIGVFSAANKIVEGFKLLPAVFYGALFPSMIKGGKSYITGVKGLKFIFAAMLIMCIVGYTYSNLIYSYFFDGFESSSTLFQILILGMLPFMIRQYFSFRLFAAGHEKQAFVIGLLTFIVALIAYHFAFMFFDLVGLCWAINLVIIFEILIYLVIGFRIKFKFW